MFKNFKEEYKKAYAKNAEKNGLPELEKAAENSTANAGSIIAFVVGLIAVSFVIYVLVTL